MLITPPNKQEQIHEISQKLTKIKNLRNRIFHYEPIFKKHHNFFHIYNEMRTILAYLPDDESNIRKNTDNFIDTTTDILKIIKNIYK